MGHTRSGRLSSKRQSGYYHTHTLSQGTTLGGQGQALRGHSWDRHFSAPAFDVIFPVGHPPGKVRKMGLRDILRYPLILAGEDSSSRLQFDHVVSEAGLTSMVNIVMTAGNVPSILNYVGLGMGVAILTRSAIEAISFPAVKKAGLAHRDASAVLGHDNLVIVHPKGRHELEHIRVFREMAAASLKADG